MNKNGDSGVIGYDIGHNYIEVWFHNSAKSYKYSYAKAGASHVENMKALAANGVGLNSYINRYVRFKYD